jgi:hypothetical protein
VLSRPNRRSSRTNRGVCAVAYWSLTENLTQSLRALSGREHVAETQPVPIHAPVRAARPMVWCPSAYGITFSSRRRIIVGGDEDDSDRAVLRNDPVACFPFRRVPSSVKNMPRNEIHQR